MLHILIKPTATVRVYDEQEKRYRIHRSTIEESRNSFMVIGPTYAELDEKFKERMEHAQKNNEILLPILGGVGEAMFDISECYVYYENVCYKFDNILSSVDTVIKMFNVLNLKFPRHCKLVWYFIQEYFYEIKTPNQDKSNNLVEILNDLKVRSIRHNTNATIFT